MAAENFYGILYKCLDQCVPKKRRCAKVKRRYPTWFTPDIIADLKLKVSLHKVWKSSKDKYVYSFFSAIRADVKYRVSQAYNRYIIQIQENLSQNPKEFWKHVKSLQTKGGFDPCITYKERKHCGKAAASAFADYFSSVFIPQVPALEASAVNECMGNNCLVNISNISYKDIDYHILKLKPKSSAGPDSIPPYVVKALKYQFTEPLSHIFNLAINKSRYPKIWKQSRVVPILKSGDKTKVENYRPIAILSCFAKLFESILHTKIYEQVEPYLTNAQHAFRQKRSVNTNLLSLVDDVSQRMDENIQVDVVYLDFRKAFDHVNNDVLLEKLSAMGLVPKLIEFFADYLRDRNQFVRLGCYDSLPYHTRSGLSQGSSLGPLLFSIMVNDVPDCLQFSKCLLYADDLKVYKSIQSLLDCAELQQDLDAIQRWSERNQLYLNIQKCQVMSFTRSMNGIITQYTINCQNITRCLIVKDLGILFDPALQFHDHMKKLTAECFKRLGFVTRNCREFTNLKAIQLLYASLIRSKIENCSSVWNPHETTYTLMLEKVQKRFLRFLYKKKLGYYPYMFPTKYLLGALGYNSLETRRLCEQLMCVCRILHGVLDCPELVLEASRLSVPEQRAKFRPGRVHLFAPSPARTTARQQSPLYRAQFHLNAILKLNPETDVFDDRIKKIFKTVLKYCEGDIKAHL